jgi:hypothetical protein
MPIKVRRNHQIYRRKYENRVHFSVMNHFQSFYDITSLGPHHPTQHAKTELLETEFHPTCQQLDEKDDGCGRSINPVLSEFASPSLDPSLASLRIPTVQ